jgi:hypothetical protein
VELLPYLPRIPICRILESVAAKFSVIGYQSGVGQAPFWAHIARDWFYVFFSISGHLW